MIRPERGPSRTSLSYMTGRPNEAFGPDAIPACEAALFISP